MKIEVGTTYKNRRGDKVLVHRNSSVSHDAIIKIVGGGEYRVGLDGRAFATRESCLDITSIWSVYDEVKRQNELAQDGVKLDLNEQRKMNNEEQSKLSSDYSKLRDILDRAYEQAASGKGKERHANGKPFDKQPIAEIGRMVGTGYNLGQAMKKAQEAQGMAIRGEKDKAAHELLGAINYLASAIMLIEDD